MGCLNFDVTAGSASTTARIAYPALGGALHGSGIVVTSIVGIDTAANDRVVRRCCACSLAFPTGAAAPATATAWMLAPGGTLTLTGGVDLNDDGDCGDPEDVPEGTRLYTGSFTSPHAVYTFGGGFRLDAGSFEAGKDAALAAFYGFPAGRRYDADVNLSFWAPGSQPPRTFTSALVFSGNTYNCVRP